MHGGDDRVDRAAIIAEYDRVAADLRHLVASADGAALRRPSHGTRWTNEQLLFHMVFGYLVVRRLLVLVRLIGRLPDRIGSGFAALLDAGTPVFDAVNYLGAVGGARVFHGEALVRRSDRVIGALHRSLEREPEVNFGLRMRYPTRWDPFFSEYMDLEEIYRYPTRHYDFHRDQLTLEGR